MYGGGFVGVVVVDEFCELFGGDCEGYVVEYVLRVVVFGDVGEFEYFCYVFYVMDFCFL